MNYAADIDGYIETDGVYKVGGSYSPEGARVFLKLEKGGRGVRVHSKNTNERFFVAPAFDNIGKISRRIPREAVSYGQQLNCLRFCLCLFRCKPTLLKQKHGRETNAEIEHPTSGYHARSLLRKAQRFPKSMTTTSS